MEPFFELGCRWLRAEIQRRSSYPTERGPEANVWNVSRRVSTDHRVHSVALIPENRSPAEKEARAALSS